MSIEGDDTSDWRSVEANWNVDRVPNENTITPQWALTPQIRRPQRAKYEPQGLQVCSSLHGMGLGVLEPTQLIVPGTIQLFDNTEARAIDHLKHSADGKTIFGASAFGFPQRSIELVHLEERVCRFHPSPRHDMQYDHGWQMAFAGLAITEGVLS